VWRLRIWGVTNTDTKALHFLLSFKRCTQSAAGNQIHCLMSSFQRPRGLPRVQFLAMIMMPCNMRVLSTWTTWPNYCHILLLISVENDTNDTTCRLYLLYSTDRVVSPVFRTADWYNLPIRYVHISNVYLFSCCLLLWLSRIHTHALQQTKSTISSRTDPPRNKWMTWQWIWPCLVLPLLPYASVYSVNSCCTMHRRRVSGAWGAKPP